MLTQVGVKRRVCRGFLHDRGYPVFGRLAFAAWAPTRQSLAGQFRPLRKSPWQSGRLSKLGYILRVLAYLRSGDLA